MMNLCKWAYRTLASFDEVEKEFDILMGVTRLHARARNESSLKEALLAVKIFVYMKMLPDPEAMIESVKGLLAQFRLLCNGFTVTLTLSLKGRWLVTF
jgi:hypothetical protein